MSKLYGHQVSSIVNVSFGCCRRPQVAPAENSCEMHSCLFYSVNDRYKLYKSISLYLVFFRNFTINKLL